jgi:hypothetical protein
VNEQPWSKQGKGFWRCTRVADRLILGQQLSQVVVELDTKEEDGDWSTYEILKDQRDGKYKAVPEECAKLKKAAYKFGVQNIVGGGVAKIGAYRLADFSAILGFDDVDKLNTFSAAAKIGLTPASRQMTAFTGLKDWNPGDSNRSRAHLQEPVDAIRQLQGVAAQAATGGPDTSPVPIEMGLAKIVNAGRRRSYAAPRRG